MPLTAAQKIKLEKLPPVVKITTEDLADKSYKKALFAKLVTSKQVRAIDMTNTEAGNYEFGPEVENGLRDLADVLKKSPHIKALDISGTAIWSARELPDALTHIEVFRAKHSYVHGDFFGICKKNGSLNNLVALDISNNGNILGDEGDMMETLGELKKLRVLNLSGTMLFESAVQPLAGHSFDILDLGNVGLGGRKNCVEEKDMAALASLKVKALGLGAAELREKDLPTILSINGLRTLDLSYIPDLTSAREKIVPLFRAKKLDAVGIGHWDDDRAVASIPKITKGITEEYFDKVFGRGSEHANSAATIKSSKAARS